MNKPILVVIPYCSQGAQGRELEYAVAGWRRHFKEDYLIVLAGEGHPVTKTGDDICCVESKRVDPVDGQYRQHLDYVSCFRKVRKAFPESEGFIFVADDCYAVNDFTLDDVKILKALPNDIFATANPFNGWEVDVVNTRSLLLREGYPIRNFTTHLPQWYEWDKLEALWEKYDMDHVSRVMEDLYYNIYFKGQEPFRLSEDDRFKCGIYRRGANMDRVKEAFEKKIWITNSPIGWSEELDKLLSEYYGI
jgi:hypothetical protein